MIKSCARAATLSGLIPYSNMTTSPGAEDPKRSIDTTSSTQRCHPIEDPASTASEGTSSGITPVRQSLGICSKSSHEGIDTTRAANPSVASFAAASRQTETSLPVPTSVIAASSASAST